MFAHSAAWPRNRERERMKYVIRTPSGWYLMQRELWGHLRHSTSDVTRAAMFASQTEALRDLQDAVLDNGDARISDEFELCSCEEVPSYKITPLRA